MNRDLDMVALGEVMLRLSPAVNEKLQTGQVLEKNAAGAELNVAAGLAQLGKRAAILTKLPDHALTRFVLGKARACGVITDTVVTDTAPTARLGVYYYEGASAPCKPSVIYDRKNASVNTLLPEETDATLPTRTRLFHTTGITLGLGGQARETAIALMRRYREAGARISFDVNFRANLWGDDQNARAVIEPLLPLVDWLFISEESLRRMFRETGELRDIMAAFAARYGLSAVATTARTVVSPSHHRFTATLYDAASGAFYTEPPYEIDIVDRVGSGDAFVAGALFGLLEGDPALAVAYGNAMAACKCTVPGDLPVTGRGEIEKLIAQHREGSGDEMER